MDQDYGRERRAVATFAGADIAAIQAQDTAVVYACLAHLCVAIGLDLESQIATIRAHTVLSTGLRSFDVTSEATRRVTSMVHLKVDLVPLWLAMVPVKRLKPEKQARVTLYQTQVADVLHRIFGSDLLPAARSEAPSAGPGYTEGLAIARMALETAQLTGEHAAKIDVFVAALEAIDERLATLEDRISPQGSLTPAQASEIADLVKQVGISLTKQMGARTSLIGQVYGDLYRLFGVTSYKLLTQAQFPEAIAYLKRQTSGGRPDETGR